MAWVGANYPGEAFGSDELRKLHSAWRMEPKGST